MVEHALCYQDVVGWNPAMILFFFASHQLYIFKQGHGKWSKQHIFYYFKLMLCNFTRNELKTSNKQQKRFCWHFLECDNDDAAANMREMSRHNGVTYHAFAQRTFSSFSPKHEEANLCKKWLESKTFIFAPKQEKWKI